MFEKLSKYNNAFNFSHVEIEALNKPEGPGWEIFSGEQELSIDKMRVVKFASKNASMDKTKDVDLNDFDIEAAVKEHPDHLFVKVFAIKKDEVNDNGDAFSDKELKAAAHTFIDCPIFCNHQNDDIEKSRGKVVHAWYDDEKGGIMIVARVDKVAYPKLARGIEEGYINGTSMGCQVHHSLCSVCHNKAHVADEYCSHVKERKTKKHSGKLKCAFHKSKCKPDGECPLCGAEKGGSKDLEHKEAQIFEWNYGLKFIEDSFVVNPACHDCLVECILNVPEYQKKVAQIRAKMEKIAREEAADKLTKIAGKVEIDLLNKAMKFMEVVAKSMMDQKDQVSMEYVSDIVDVMAKSQTVTDELIEMGYGQLQSPTTLQDPDAVGDAVAVGAQEGQQTSPQAMQPSQQPQQPAGSTTNPAGGGIGSVTKPSFASVDKKKKELEKTGEYLKERITSLVDIVDRYDGQQFDFSGIISEIDKVAESITSTVKESGNTMSKENTEKTAAGSGLTSEMQGITTEKQLSNAKLEDWAGNRQGKEINTITEGSEQLGGTGAPKDVTTDSPQQRTNEYADYTTENQIAKDMKESEVTRWNSYPEVITEKQWTDFNRAVGAVLSEDQHNHVTQAQLEDLRKNHRWTEPNFTTENQLKDTTNWLATDNAWLNKEAAAGYAKALVQAAVDALSDTIAYYKRTPAEIVKAAKYITRDPNAQLKAAFITLINGMPKKSEKRKAAIARLAYFNSDSNIEATDALLACMGDHCKNLKAEDFVEAIRTIATSADKMQAVEAASKKKNALASTLVDDTIDKTAAFEDAFKSITGGDTTKTASAEVDKSVSADDDGLHQVRSSVIEIKADISDRDAFTRAAEKFAQVQIGRDDAVLYSIEVDEENGAVVTTLKEASKLTPEESANYEKYASQQRSSKRDGLVREAQMMGGEQPPMGGGAAGGQGATMPQPPAGGGQPPMPPAETMDGSDEAAAEDGDEGGEQPLPPGSLCPVCGTQDVDVVAGKGKCNNPECGSEFVFKVNIEVTKYKGVTDNGDDDAGQTGNDGAPLDGDQGTQEGEGFAMPDNGETPSTPIAAMTRLNPEQIKKFAAKEGWELGRVSPVTGSNNTAWTGKTKDGADKYLCMDSGATYSVRTAYAKGDPKNLYVEWRWLPKVAGSGCNSCKRAKAAWTKALKSAGLTDAEFDVLSFKAKADKVLEMKSAGHFAVVKTASKTGDIIGEYKKAYTVQGKFPYESCVQKLANRYGENAIALSGPNKGQNLAECVCKQLKSASTYNDRLALKIADTWKDKDACIECMEDFVRVGYDMEKAATVCQHLKVKYASSEELFAEAMGEPMMGQPTPPGGGMGGGRGGAPAPAAPPAAPAMGGGMGAADVDPFAAPQDQMAGGGNGAEDINLGDISNDLGGGSPDLSVGVEPAGDGAMEVELGGDMAGDMTVDQSGQGGNSSVSIELPVEAVKALDVALQTVMHGQLGGATEVGSELGGDLAPDGGESNEGISGGDKGGDDEGDGDVPNFNDDDGDDDGGDKKGPSMDNDNEIKEGDDADRFASYMRRGKISGQGEINLDVQKILEAMNKKANEVTPKQEGSQDVVDGYGGDGGSAQGNEAGFSADKPDVPRAQATIGNEPSDLNPKDKPLPTVPKGGSEATLEGEKNYKAESGVNLSGGLAGAGKSETASAKKKTTKVAGEKKVDAEPVSDVIEVEIDFSDNKDLSSTPDFLKRTPFEESDRKEINNVPEKGEGAFIGDEKTSIEFVPKSPANNPSIPTGDGFLSKENNEKNKPELTDKIKGFVAANSGEKSKQIEAEAERIAVRMLKAELIEDGQLLKKVAELRRYDLPQLKDIENSIFKAAKGLATEPDGVGHQPVPVISDASNDRSGGIKDALQSLFSLDQRNKIASELTDENLRKAHGR